MSTVIGIGIDLVELCRIERIYSQHPARLVERICRPGEVKPRRGKALIQHLGGLFAAKEAVLKALGTGWDRGLGFRQVEVVSAAGGGPAIALHGRAAVHAEAIGVHRIHVSITHEREYAAAMAVAEGASPRDRHAP
jgi:holo-[acyl-carrier protein] synthase